MMNKFENIIIINAIIIYFFAIVFYYVCFSFLEFNEFKDIISHINAFFVDNFAGIKSQQNTGQLLYGNGLYIGYISSISIYCIPFVIFSSILVYIKYDKWQIINKENISKRINHVLLLGLFVLLILYALLFLDWKNPSWSSKHWFTLIGSTISSFSATYIISFFILSLINLVRFFSNYPPPKNKK